MAHEGPHSWKDAAQSRLGYTWLSPASSVSRKSPAGARSAAPGRAPLWLLLPLSGRHACSPTSPSSVSGLSSFTGHTLPLPGNESHGPLHWTRGLCLTNRNFYRFGWISCRLGMSPPPDHEPPCSTLLPSRPRPTCV